MTDYASLLTPGIVKSFPQETDLIYQPLAGPFADAIDLMPDVLEVDDQGQEGSCTANAVTSQLELMLKRDGRPLSLSRRFNYYGSRYIILEQPGISGSTLRAAIRSAKHQGVCAESTWHYDAETVNTVPSDAAFSEAILRRIQRYERIDNDLGGWPPIGNLTEAEWRELIAGIVGEKIIKGVRSALNEGLSVSFACAIGAKLPDLAGPWQEHPYPRIGPDNPKIGNHAMHLIGYDEPQQVFLVENSWGPNRGDGGFFGMSYDAIARDWMEGFVVRGFDGIYVNDPLQSEWDKVQKMYLGFYHRPADLGGMLYWRDRLIQDGYPSVAEAFMTSPEAEGFYGDIREANRATRRG